MINSGGTTADRIRQQRAQRQCCGHVHDQGDPEPEPAPPEPGIDQDWKPFPLDRLPVALRTFATGVSMAMACDPVFVVLPALSAVAGCIGTTRVIRLKPGWEEPCAVWSAIVAWSGTAKTPAQEEAVRPLAEMNIDLMEEYQEELRRHEEIMDERKGKRALTSKPPAPPARRHVLCEDVTIESVGNILAGNPRGVLVSRDELSAWIGSFQRYRKNGSDESAWLSLHRAGSLTVDRKSGPGIAVRRALVSITGGIQPGILTRCVTESMRESGLMARLLFAMPPRRAKVWSDDGIHEDLRAGWDALLRQLLRLDFDQARPGKARPVVVSLSGQAHDAFVPWYNRWNAKLAEQPGEIASTMAKLEAYAGRLALIHHIVECLHHGNSEHGLIGAESIEAGTALAEWFLDEAIRVLALVGDRGNQDEADRLVKRFGVGKILTARDLQKSNGKHYPTAKAATEALARLVGTARAHWWDRKLGRQAAAPTEPAAVKLVA